MQTAELKSLLRGIIKVMRQENTAPTRTRLVKFLYLADLHYARYHEGRTATGWRWYVGPFGPVATEALGLLDEGVREGWMRLWYSDHEDADEDESRHTAVIYDLQGDGVAELPPQFGKVRDWVRRYGDSTNGLLRFVYGNTEPMLGAGDGEFLDFTTAMNPKDAKPIETRLGTKDSRRAKALLVSIAASVDAANSTEPADPSLYDDVFRSGVPRDEGLPTGHDFLLKFRDED